MATAKDVKEDVTMKFIVEREPLIDAVNWVARSLSARPMITALLGIKIEVGTEIKLTGSNLETSTEAVIDANIQEKGMVLVKGQLLAEIVRSLPNSTITFTLEGTRVIVSAGTSKFTLPTLEANEYPNLPALPGAAGDIAGDEFVKAVNQVVVAASRDDSLPKFTGVDIQIKKDKITLAATDRYRLAIKTLPWKANDPDLETSALVRARTLSDAAKSLSTGSQITLALSPADSKESLIGFVSNTKSMTSRTLDETLPSFEHLIPAESKAEATIEISKLLDSVRRVALVTDKTLPLILTFADNTLVLEAGGDQDAQASESIEIQHSGEEIRTGYNPTFLIDGLQALDAPFVHFSFTASNKLAVLTGKPELDGARDESYKYLLNPMRL